jgi:hypothetical protein
MNKFAGSLPIRLALLTPALALIFWLASSAQAQG